jgi:hypothetical protein
MTWRNKLVRRRPNYLLILFADRSIEPIVSHANSLPFNFIDLEKSRLQG